MNWKIKGVGQLVLSHFPCPATLNYWCQKYITKAHEDYAELVANRFSKARWFAAQFERSGERPLDQAEFYEFGAGWNLAGPLALYCLGVNRQVVVDIMPCARLELVNAAVAEMNRLPDAAPRRPGRPLQSLAELEERFGIIYRAPVDARRTEIPDASIDCITSTYTLEHIPASDIALLLTECRRILRPAGVMLSMIDYQDHYSYRDSRISVYNFLQYSHSKWRWFNSSLHYQNRLRHCEYRQMFTRAGFAVLSEDLESPSPQLAERLKSVRLSPEFRSFSFAELAVLGSQMVCRGEAVISVDGHSTDEPAVSAA
ncbi:MAG TPA: methyltransferase domain-containing protein [Bryobacteraceae bacterium]|nr:methyltransferase domain-containing protein [Bryobacteraceae bacterium]